MTDSFLLQSLATPGYVSIATQFVSATCGSLDEQVVTFGHLNRENLARCAGINLEDDEITAAKEVRTMHHSQFNSV